MVRVGNVCKTLRVWVLSLFLVMVPAIGTEAAPFAYVASGSNVSVIDNVSKTEATAVPVETQPEGVAITPDGAFAYVASQNHRITVIKTATNTVVANVGGPGIAFPVAVAITPNGAYVYVANDTGPNAFVSVIATASNTVVANVPVTCCPAGVAITSDGNYAYVTNGGNAVFVIKTATNTVVSTVSVGAGPKGVASTPDSAFVYVANRNSNTVSVIKTANNTVVATVPVGTALIPRTVAATVAVSATASVAGEGFTEETSVLELPLAFRRTVTPA
jgi:YVTN family beta-propeller protein